MAYGNNRAAARPRATFRVVGGSIYKFRHPVLSGQISGESPVDEIDVSRCLQLNGTYLEARPTQKSAIHELLVDGSVITITNHVMAGSMKLNVMPTTMLVGTGDFIAAAQLIIASKDDVGGTFTAIENVDGKRIVTVFYGVSFEDVPHMIRAGNTVVPYQITMLYAGWTQGVSSNTELNEKTVWAVGNKVGLKGVYKPYAIQDAENRPNYYGGTPISESVSGVGVGNGDTATGDLEGIAAIPDPLADGMSGTPAPETVTWSE
jgi:hypothetical protein